MVYKGKKTTECFSLAGKATQRQTHLGLRRGSREGRSKPSNRDVGTINE